MFINGKMYDNISCKKCSHRHPKEFTCEHVRGLREGGAHAPRSRRGWPAARCADTQHAAQRSGRLEAEHMRKGDGRPACWLPGSPCCMMRRSSKRRGAGHERANMDVLLADRRRVPVLRRRARPQRTPAARARMSPTRYSRLSAGASMFFPGHPVRLPASGNVSRRPKTTEPCGCVSDGRQWLSMCEAHETFHRETSARWRADHIRLMAESEARGRGSQKSLA